MPAAAGKLRAQSRFDLIPRGSTTADSPSVSVIVPTYREAENLRTLVTRIAAAVNLLKSRFEILIVDDNSGDGTEEVAKDLSREYPLRLIVRTRDRDLSLSALEGLRQARGEYLVVMDADLSHPPEQISELIAPLREDRADFVLGSRYVAGGSTHNWGGDRRVNSLGATLLAKPLSRGLLDPMSGFFALRRKTFENARQLNPIGYKIGLELLCRCHIERPLEIPIRFQDRVKGESKLNLEQQARYVIHLNRLYRDHARAPGLAIRPILAGMLAAIRTAQAAKRQRTS